MSTLGSPIRSLAFLQKPETMESLRLSLKLLGSRCENDAVSVSYSSFSWDKGQVRRRLLSSPPALYPGEPT